MDCLNCGTPLTGRHCVACGQAASTTRLGLRDLGRPLFALFDADRGWLHTVAELSQRPGRVITDYLAGKRVAYSEPVKFTVLAVALAMFALWLAPMPTRSAAEAETAMANQTGELLQRYGNALLLMTVPLMAAVSRWLFRARGLNFAEHVVLNSYAFAQQNLMSLPFVALGVWQPDWYGYGMLVYYGATLAYYAWVLRAVVARAWWSAILAAAGITAVAYVLFWLLFSAIAALTLAP